MFRCTLAEIEFTMFTPGLAIFYTLTYSATFLRMSRAWLSRMFLEHSIHMCVQAAAGAWH